MVYVIKFSDIECMINDIGYEKTIANLKSIKRHLMNLHLEYLEIDMLISVIERRYSEDFWSGWKEYES